MSINICHRMITFYYEPDLYVCVYIIYLQIRDRCYKLFLHHVKTNGNGNQPLREVELNETRGKENGKYNRYEIRKCDLILEIIETCHFGN